ncbi:hypothetical protein E2562_036006 [Oryza meyeriana var. granulata]|uniref:Uncharacterized protein n=1 Tax=Oryza meyeriana var. granulata TaxID=110450 RepID=A0A6G1CWW1_9ORYZ|nr:hypothetical protein E2562_036006 [Oryza meyeriana var. granulata]
MGSELSDISKILIDIAIKLQELTLKFGALEPSVPLTKKLDGLLEKITTLEALTFRRTKQEATVGMAIKSVVVPPIQLSPHKPIALHHRPSPLRPRKQGALKQRSHNISRRGMKTMLLDVVVGSSSTMPHQPTVVVTNQAKQRRDRCRQGPLRMRPSTSCSVMATTSLPPSFYQAT